MTIQTTTTRKARGAPSKAIDASGIGVMVHRAIGALLTAGHTDPSPEQVVRSVGAFPFDASDSYLLAARQQVLTATSIYFAFFAPPCDWTLIGVEVLAPATRFDLVWRTPDGILVDEIKTGRFVTLDDRRGVTAQAERQLVAGGELYGDEFVGVRIVCVSAPRLSRILKPNGDSHDVLAATA